MGVSQPRHIGSNPGAQRRAPLPACAQGRTAWPANELTNGRVGGQLSSSARPRAERTRPAQALSARGLSPTAAPPRTGTARLLHARAQWPAAHAARPARNGCEPIGTTTVVLPPRASSHAPLSPGTAAGTPRITVGYCAPWTGSMSEITRATHDEAPANLVRALSSLDPRLCAELELRGSAHHSTSRSSPNPALPLAALPLAYSYTVTHRSSHHSARTGPGMRPMRRSDRTVASSSVYVTAR